MKILVTGHKGFIGGKIFEELLNMGHDVKGIDLKEGEDVLYCFLKKLIPYLSIRYTKEVIVAVPNSNSLLFIESKVSLDE